MCRWVEISEVDVQLKLQTMSCSSSSCFLTVLKFNPQFISGRLKPICCYIVTILKTLWEKNGLFSSKFISQCRSKFQWTIVQATSSELLDFLSPNIVWWCTTECQSVLQIFSGTVKVKATIMAHIYIWKYDFPKCFLNCWFFRIQTWYGSTLLHAIMFCQEIDLLTSRS